MKKIINGKKYDTETAKQIGVFANAGSWRDFEHIEEALYLKKSGEYFLHGEGGPQTKYAVSEGQNSWTGGQKIMPLSYDNAKEWAEENLTADEYEAAFGVVEDDETQVTLNAKISAAVDSKLRRMAAAEGTTIKAVLERIITEASTK